MSRVGRIQEMTDEEIKNIDPKEVAYITLNSGEIILKKSDVEENKGYQNVEGNVNIKNDGSPKVFEFVEIDAIPVRKQKDEVTNKVTQRIVKDVRQKLKNRTTNENNFPKNIIPENHPCQFCARQGQLTKNFNFGTNLKDIQPLFFSLDQTPQYFQYQPKPVTQLFQPVETGYLKAYVQVPQNIKQSIRKPYSQNEYKIKKLIKNKKSLNVESERISNLTQSQPERVKRKELFRHVYAQPQESLVFNNTITYGRNNRYPLEQSQAVSENFTQTDFEWRDRKLRGDRTRTGCKSVEQNLRNTRGLRLPNHNYLEVDCSRHKVTNDYKNDYNNTVY